MISRLLPPGSRRGQLVRKLFLEPKIPPYIARKFITPQISDLDLLKASLEKNFFAKEPRGYLSTQVGKKDLLDHLTARLDSNRKFTIPWLNSVRHLENSRVLEIGCGTGSSTVALAEQGAKVTAIDIDEKALIDAETRCHIYGQKADFYQMNSMEVREHFPNEKFDFIIFWACLEHMTLEERIISLKGSWEMLSAGDFLCVTKTPNRLYFYDSHTSEMPFFLWLPDELAIKYSLYSPRQKYRENFSTYDGEKDHMVGFYRSGRGLSFHEFELTMKPLSQLKIISCMNIYLRRKSIFHFLKALGSKNYRYEYFLHKLFPEIHRGFLQPYLDLIVQKD
jgi:S-adenosylmethionine-dependent methyltransferase